MIFKHFRKIFGNLWKLSEIIGKFADVVGTVRKRSQQLKCFGDVLRSPRKAHSITGARK